MLAVAACRTSFGVRTGVAPRVQCNRAVMTFGKCSASVWMGAGSGRTAVVHHAAHYGPFVEQDCSPWPA